MRALVSRLGILLPAAVLSVSVSLVATIPRRSPQVRASAPAASAGVRRLTVNQSLSPTAFISKETRVIHELVRDVRSAPGVRTRRSYSITYYSLTNSTGSVTLVYVDGYQGEIELLAKDGSRLGSE